MLYRPTHMRAETGTATKTTAKARPLTGRLLAHGADELSEADLQEYIRLLRAGDPQSLATAAMIFPGASKDAAAVRNLRQLLQQKPDVGEANGRKDWLKGELATLDDQILDLRAKRNLLQRDLDAVENMAGSFAGWRRHVLHLAGSEPIARLALADELHAAGF